MTRSLCSVLVFALMLGSAAHAGSFSFSIAGHRISISAAHHCLSPSCVSVFIPGLVAARHRRNDDVVTAQSVLRPRPTLQVPATVASAAPVPQMASVETRAVIAPPVPPPAPTLAAAEDAHIRVLPAPPPSLPQPVAPTPIAQLTESAPSVQPIVETEPVEAPAPPPVAADPVSAASPAIKANPVVDTIPDDTPLGDWQTEGKTGAVRIEACGKTLCGYLINPSSRAKGETILINMKSKSEVEWRGSIFSRVSGSTYNATMTLKQPNLLRVEACALGHFLCSGNNWTRIVKQPSLVTSRDERGAPHS